MTLDQLDRASLVRFVRSHRCTADEAEDAVQDTFVILAHAGSRIVGDPGPYARTVAKRRLWEIQRRASEDTILERLDTAQVEHPHSELGRVLRHLKRDEAIALLDTLAGRSYAEISERRGWSYTKVNRCLTEGRARLRAIYPNADALRDAVTQ